MIQAVGMEDAQLSRLGVEFRCWYLWLEHPTHLTQIIDAFEMAKEDGFTIVAQNETW